MLILLTPCSLMLKMLNDFISKREEANKCSLQKKVVHLTAFSYVLIIFQVHLEETADPWYRGIISSFHHVLFFSGILLMSTFGALLQWRMVCIITTLISGVTIFLHLFSLESPSWLVRKNRIKDAEKCLLKLWGPGLENKVCVDNNFTINYTYCKK